MARLLSHKRASLLRLAQCYLLTGPYDVFGRVAIDLRMRRLDWEILRLERARAEAPASIGAPSGRVTTRRDSLPTG